jgi:uncharacterized membrane protein
MKSKLYVGIGGLALASIVLFILGSVGSNPTGASVAATDTDYGITDTDYGIVEIPLSEISETAKFYSLDVDGVTVNYFAVRGSEGEVRTAFDACDICGGYKGYRQVGSDMFCNNCGRHFNIDDIGTKNLGGGCWPSYLSHETVGNNIVIGEAEIAAGRWRFA